MTDRPTDDQIRQALLRRGRAQPPEDLRMHILSTAARTSQVSVRQPWRLPVSQPVLRLAYLAALLALLAAIAFASLSGGNHGPALIADATPSPSASASASPTPSATPVPSTSPTPAVTDADMAVAAVTTYEQALAALDFQTAWNLRATPSQAGQTLESFSTERSQFLASSKGTFELKAPDHKSADIEPWLAPGVTDGIDPARTYLIEVDFPALAGNNAGYEIFLVSPDTAGNWRLWEVR